MNGLLVHFSRDRFRSPLATHLAWFTMLVLMVCGLAIWLGMEWKALARDTGSSVAEKRTELESLTAANVDLRGLRSRLSDTQKQIDTFYDHRLLANYSSIAQRIGEIEIQSGVNLTHVVYLQQPHGSGLTEIVVESDVGGEYPQIMRFVNGLERDDAYFVIRSMTLVTQQGGQVNLRIRFSTWLRPYDAAASTIPAATASGPVLNSLNAASKEE